MLFVCYVCKFGYSADAVHTFRSKAGKTMYLCDSHLTCRTPVMKHIPWISEWSESGCNICKDGQLCCGIHQPGVIVHGYGANFCISRTD